MNRIQKLLFSMALGVGLASTGHMQAGFLDFMKKSTASIYYVGAQALRIGIQIGATNAIAHAADTYITSKPGASSILSWVTWALKKVTVYYSSNLVLKFCKTYIRDHRFFTPRITNQKLYPMHHTVTTIGDYTADGFAKTGIIPYLSSAPNGFRLACAPLVGYATKLIPLALTALQKTLAARAAAQEAQQEDTE